jgi:uncharacterized spore protein YtfJ
VSAEPVTEPAIIVTATFERGVEPVTVTVTVDGDGVYVVPLDEDGDLYNRLMDAVDAVIEEGRAREADR